jgi:hypothetical protein
MQIKLTPAAEAFLVNLGQTELTVSSLVFSSCCAGPLPPEVKPGAPADPDGFELQRLGRWTLYWDSLLDPRPTVVIDVKDYAKYQELYILDWE